MTNKKSEKFPLYWVCTKTGKSLPAGVAFYNEDQGDYRLKIDAFPEGKLIFLKQVSLSDKAIHYRVETVVTRAGQATHRTQIGTAYSNSDGSLPVFMDIGPFSKVLMMEAS